MKEQEATNESADFSKSVTATLGKSNEKRAVLWLIFVIALIVLLAAGAVANLLTLAFQISRIFGYVCTAAAALSIYRKNCITSPPEIANVFTAKRKNNSNLRKKSRHICPIFRKHTARLPSDLTIVSLPFHCCLIFLTVNRKSPLETA